jgi:hypothetical protein
MVGNPVEIVGEGRQAAGQMGVGNLGQAECGHRWVPLSDDIGTGDRKDVMQFTIRGRDLIPPGDARPMVARLCLAALQEIDLSGRGAGAMSSQACAVQFWTFRG